MLIGVPFLHSTACMHLGNIRILVQDSSDWVWRKVHMRITNVSMITLQAPLGMCAKVGTMVFRMVFRVVSGPCMEGEELCGLNGQGTTSYSTVFEA